MGQGEVVSIGLSIVKRDDGGVRIITSLPGLYLSGANARSVFADLGPALRRLLVDNERVEWLRSDEPPMAPELNLFEDKEKPGDWRVEFFDEEGTCYGATFWGREAEARAREYARIKYSNLCQANDCDLG
jgi:hypothetical protein